MQRTGPPPCAQPFWKFVCHLSVRPSFPARSLMSALGRRAARLVFLRFRPFGHPPRLAFSRAAFAFAGVEMLPSIAAALIGFPQCWQFIVADMVSSRSSAIYRCISGCSARGWMYIFRSGSIQRPHSAHHLPSSSHATLTIAALFRRLGSRIGLCT